MNQLPGWFVVLIGLGIVFVGLLSIILLCKVLGAICRNLNNETETAGKSAAPAQNKPVFANRQEVIAAISAAIAEESGVDPAGIRILSVKRI